MGWTLIPAKAIHENGNIPLNKMKSHWDVIGFGKRDKGFGWDSGENCMKRYRNFSIKLWERDSDEPFP